MAIAVIPRLLAQKHLFENNHAARLGVENEIRRTIIQMLGGSFVLVSVFSTYETADQPADVDADGDDVGGTGIEPVTSAV